MGRTSKSASKAPNDYIFDFIQHFVDNDVISTSRVSL